MLSSSDPYAAPSSPLKPDERPRISHGLVGMASALLGLPLFILLLSAVAQGRSPAFNYPEDLKAVALIVASATIAGLMLLPFRGMKWPLAAVLGVILGFLMMIAISFVAIIVLRV